MPGFCFADLHLMSSGSGVPGSALSATLEEGQLVLMELPSIAAEAVAPLSPVPAELLPMPGLRGAGSEDFLVLRDGNLGDHYILQRVLGRGGFGTVWKAKARRTGQLRAVKSLQPELLRADCPELQIWPRLDHPSIVALYEGFRDAQGLHLVMEICAGGSLARKIESYWSDFNLLVGSPGTKGLPGGLVALYLWQLLVAVVYLHHHRLAHRDVKPENCLLRGQEDEAPLKLADFGAACSYMKGTPMTEKVGTPHYAAPEVLAGSYDERCDVWSAGVVGYMACVGYRPFHGRTEQETRRMVSCGKAEFKAAHWKPQPAALRELVARLLTATQAERPSAKQAIVQSDWLRRFGRPREGNIRYCPLS